MEEMRRGESWNRLLFPEIDCEWSGRYTGIWSRKWWLLFGVGDRIDLCCLYANGKRH